VLNESFLLGNETEIHGLFHQLEELLWPLIAVSRHSDIQRPDFDQSELVWFLYY